MVSGNFPKSN